MKNNNYTLSVDGKKLDNFEFIMGPMLCVSIPRPPRKPEEFIKAAYEGGATPIVAPRDTGKNGRALYVEDIIKIRQGMGEGRFGINFMAVSPGKQEFIADINKLGDEGPDFFDINGIEMCFDETLPLLKDIPHPIYLGFHQPMSVYAFLKYLQQKEYTFLVDRFAAGTLKLYLPRARGGGHLPVIKQDQLDSDWDDALVKEVQGIEKALNVSVPFIIEKNMVTIDDFVNTIKKYADYSSFCGVRFGSILLMTRECPFTDEVKGLITDMVKTQNREMLLPLRSVLASVKRGKKLRGGVITYYMATKFARMIFDQQRGDEDFPRFSRPFVEDLYQYQKTRTSNLPLCHSCLTGCPHEYCEIRGVVEASNPDASIDDALVTISPRIFDIDPDYIGASATDVVRDVIQKTLSHFK